MEAAPASSVTEAAFRKRFVEAFDAHFPRLFRVLDRASDDPELASDLAQEAFVRLYRRGVLPESTEAWLISVAMNLLRNVRVRERRRRHLLSRAPEGTGQGTPPPAPDRGIEHLGAERGVRMALDGLAERERHLLLLRAEGYSYRDIAAALDLHEASVGTMLARARRTFMEAYRERTHAS